MLSFSDQRCGKIREATTESPDLKRVQTVHLGRRSDSRPQRLAWLPIFAFLLAVGVLAWLRIETAWNPPPLLPLLNILSD
jgi:hypothetical protein